MRLCSLHFGISWLSFKLAVVMILRLASKCPLFVALTCRESHWNNLAIEICMLMFCWILMPETLCTGKLYQGYFIRFTQLLSGRLLIPQQHKLMGSSAQNSSGVHWCRRRVRFNEVLEKVRRFWRRSGRLWCRARSRSTGFEGRYGLVDKTHPSCVRPGFNIRVQH